LGTRIQEISTAPYLWNPGKNTSQNPWFENQFAGLNAAKTIEVKTGTEWPLMTPEAKEKIKQANSISALTGATLSSVAVAKAVSQKAPDILRAFYPPVFTAAADSETVDTLLQKKDEE
jgi:hypothetical protein